MGLLRLLLALSVVLDHSTPFLGFSLVGGQVAVESFFIISGFYMALILSTKYKNLKDYWLFISNRALRLFFAYWMVMFSILAMSIVSLIFLQNPGKLKPYIEHTELVNLSNLILLAFLIFQSLDRI